MKIQGYTPNPKELRSEILFTVFRFVQLLPLADQANEEPLSRERVHFRVLDIAEYVSYSTCRSVNSEVFEDGWVFSSSLHRPIFEEFVERELTARVRYDAIATDVFRHHLVRKDSF